MPTPSDVPRAPVAPTAGLAAPVSRSVAEDLEAIFPHAPPRPPGTRPRLGGGGERRSRGSQRRIAGAGALAAAVLVGVSAGAMIGRDPAPRAASASPGSEHIKLVVAPSAQPQRAVVTAATPPAALPSPGPLAPPQLVRAAVETGPAPAVVPAKAVERPRSRHAVKVARRKAETAPLQRCGGDCGHDDVMAADARLRRSYAAAVDAGAPRSVLVGYRNEWSSLRHRASDHPGLVVWRYSAMARDLDRYASAPRVAEAPRRRSRPLEGLRAELASLWN